MSRASLIAIALATAIAADGRRASAFVRYRTDSGAGFYWAQPVVPMTAYPNDFVETPMAMSIAEVESAVAAAAGAWSQAQNPCTYLDLQVAFSTGPAPVAGDDNRNSVIFRSTSWCQLGADGTCEIEYDTVALAVTSDIADTRSGQIYDADVEVNVHDITWADVVAHPELNGYYDLQNALTHEMGHFIGLAHTCYNALVDAMRDDDNNGNPIPDCDTAPLDVQATTMFPSADAGDVQKRTLAPDDQNGLCTIYPVDDPPANGSVRGGCGSCDAADPRPADAALESSVLILLVAWAGRARMSRAKRR
jgi:hypothetical protein